MKKRIIILADEALRPMHSKSESVLIRYLQKEIIGVVDRVNAGKTLQQVLGFGGEIPVTATLDELLKLKPNHIIIGLSKTGGGLPVALYPLIIKALQMRLTIINGYHQFLNETAEFKLLADKYKVKIIDLRSTDDKYLKFRGRTKNLKSRNIMTIGTNELSGKLTTTIELVSGLHQRGVSADWLATSLTGRLVKGKGIITDATRSDLVSATVENEMVGMGDKFEYIVIEGRGGIYNPVSASANIGILHGAMPDALILCHRAEINDSQTILTNTIETYRQLLSAINSAPVLVISLNTAMLSESEAASQIQKVETKFGLPVTDPVRFGVDKIADTLINYFSK
ncbi:MAG: DUF1611 domain-containing protein [Calditrichaceae bacterium]